MALKAIVFHQCEESFDFAMIVDIVRKYVFREWISGRSMNEQEFSVLMESGQCSEEFQAFLVARIVGSFELFTGPEDGTFRVHVESFWITQRSHVVIAKQTDAASGHD
jgi:hypothetical protein